MGFKLVCAEMQLAAHHDSIEFFYTLMAWYSIISIQPLLLWTVGEPSFIDADEVHFDFAMILFTAQWILK